MQGRAGRTSAPDQPWAADVFHPFGPGSPDSPGSPAALVVARRVLVEREGLPDAPA